MKRVVFFSPGHLDVGGAGSRSRRLAAGFAERGWDVRVIARSGATWPPRRVRSDGVLLIEIPGLGAGRLGAVAFLAAALPLGMLWGKKARCLIAIQLSSQSVAAAVCSFVTGRPYIALGTISGQLSEVRYVTGGVLAPVRKGLFRRASFLVAQSTEMAEEMEALLPRERIAVVPSPTVVVEPPPLTGEPRALFAGRFAREKDLLRLVDAWSAIVKESDDARLVLAGSGGGYRSVEAELREKVGSDQSTSLTVTFTGWLADMRPQLAACDVYICPSLSEGMSNSLVEACAWGRVVVASDIQPNREVVGDGYPLLFRTGDTNDLIACLRRALFDDDVRSEARAEVLRRATSFSVESVMDRFEQLVAMASAEWDRGT